MMNTIKEKKILARNNSVKIYLRKTKVVKKGIASHGIEEIIHTMTK